MFTVMDDIVQKLSTLTETEYHILLYCQGIGLWVEVVWQCSWRSLWFQQFQHFLEDIRREYDKMNPVRNREVGGTF